MSPHEPQPVYLLAGGHGRGLRRTFADLRAIIDGLGKAKPVVAYVGVASLEENWMIYAVSSGLIKAGCRCRLARVVMARPRADLAKAREVLRNADAVFMSGGDVEAGMRILAEKDMVGFLQDLARGGKPFIGISAGTIMLAREWVRWKDPDDDATAEIFPCLGIAPLLCDTHAEDDDWEELKTALRLKGPGLGYGLVSGSQLRVYPDGRLEAKSGPVAVFEARARKIQRLADLEPLVDDPGGPPEA